MNRLFRQPQSAGALLILRHGPYELVLAPDCGARIAAFRFEGRDVLRPASPEALAEGLVYGFAGFPLMPYSGPVFSEGFIHAGVMHALARNVREEPTATHGEAWIRPWTVVTRTPRAVDLVLDHHPGLGTFPFAWRGSLRFALEADGLSVDMALTCRDHQPMPAGIGFHPYFPKPPGTRLRFEALAVWPPDGPEAVEQTCMPIPPGLNFADGPDVAERVIDRCYEGWGGIAEIIAPGGFRSHLTATGALRRLQVYSAWDYPYVCVEPVSNANDGFNRAARGVACHGVADLGPGETLQGRFRIAASQPRM